MKRAIAVLIADDDHDFVQVVLRCLRELGHEGHMVADAHEAMARLRATRYDLLITDIHLPAGDDLQFVRSLSMIAPGMPVILVTNAPSIDSAIDAFHLPVTAYLPKPVDEEVLTNAIRAAVTRSHIYSTVCRVLRHLENCVHDLNDVREGGLASRIESRRDTEAVPLVTLRLLAACLSELLTLEDGLNPGKDMSCLCDLLDCPQRGVHRDMMRDTVLVLERTKGMFKSRELGRLRHHLAVGPT